MVGKIYREGSCRDAGADGDFMFRAESQEEVLRIMADPACRSHPLCEFSPDMKSKGSSQIKTGTL